MILSKVERCKFLPNSRRCHNCKITIDDKYAGCKICSNSYEKLSPIWHFFFTVSIGNDKTLRNVEGFGNIFDNVIGMSIDDFIFLSNELGDLSADLTRYFTNGFFMIKISFKRIEAIQLQPGNQLTFLRWFGLMCKYPEDVIINTLLSRVSLNFCKCYENDLSKDDDFN